MNEIVTLRIVGRPIPFARPATDRQGNRHNPTRYRDYRRAAADQIRLIAGRNRIRTLEGPLTAELIVTADYVDLEFCPAMFPSLNRPAGLRGDLDNYAKAVFDSAQTAGLIGDDRQIVEIAARFHDLKETPR